MHLTSSDPGKISFLSEMRDAEAPVSSCIGKVTPLTLASTIMADSGLPFFTANNSLVTDGSSLADSQMLDSVEDSCELPTYPVR